MQVAEISPHNKCNNLLAGISAVVGLIGGVYLLTSGAKTIFDKIVEGRFAKKEPVIDNICNVCSRQIHTIDTKSFITCCVCNKRICNDAKCSNLLPKSSRWVCQLCHTSNDSLTHTQSWIADQMFFNRQKYMYHPMRARSEIYIPIRNYNEDSTIFESVSQVGLNPSVITASQKANIREYVEEVLSTLLSGSLDQNRVTQLSKSENYLPGIMNNYVVHQHSMGLNENQTNENILTKSPEISQTRLRHMVESIIAEMLATPNIANVNVSELELNTHKNVNGRPQHCHRYRTEHYFEPKAYQDFLTTTVLNKITHKEANVHRFSESTPDLSSSNIDVNFNMEDRSTSSNSSLGPTRAFSYADAERSPNVIKDLDRELILNDYITSHTVPLPDLSNAMTESEDDDNASISSSILIEGNWEDNWLFKKKRPSITTSMTGSIGILIPAPKDDVRAQIGDKTTDEISDLSEMESDTDDSSLKIYSSLDPRSDRILNKHLIGGQNTKVFLDELIETASLISNTSLPHNEANYFETMNEHVLEVASKTEVFNSNIASSSPEEVEINLNSKPKSYYKDHLTPETENNSLSAPLQTTDSIQVDDSYTGCSSVENVLSHDTRSICPGASVIEILAAITLGPLLAVSASEKSSIQAPFEMSSLKDLSDIALTEIKSRAPELRHHSLDVIDEEEETKVMNSLNEICSQKGVVLADIKANTTSPHINDAFRKLTDENPLQSESMLSLEVRHHTITYNSNEAPAEDTEPGTRFVIDKKSANQTSSSKQKECDYETKSHKTSEIPYTTDTDNNEYTNEQKGGFVMDKGSLEISATENEKQTPRTEPEVECITDTKSENGIPFRKQPDHCAYEPIAHETSDIPASSDTVKQESSSKATIDSVRVAESAEISTEREKQKPSNGPKEEKAMHKETEIRIPFSDQSEGCDNYTQVKEFSETPYISATESLETISESHLNRVMDTATKKLFAINTEASNNSYTADIDKHGSNSEEKEGNIEASEAAEDSAPQREKQKPSNEPEIECVTDRESENRITFRAPKEECANDTETREFFEISYICATENLEHFKELNRDRVIETAALKLIVTKTEGQEVSKTLFPSDNDKHESSSEEKEDSGMDKEALEFSATENHKQTSCTEPEGECNKDAKNENEIPYSKQTYQSAYDADIHETSGTPVAYNTEPGAEYVIDKDSANRIPFSKQTESAYETEIHKTSETRVTSDTGNQESRSETKGDFVKDRVIHEFSATESEKQTSCIAPEREFIMNTESENGISFSIQKEECAFDVKDPESSSEEKGDSVVDTETAKISTTNHEKQNPFNVTDTEIDNRTSSNDPKKRCGKNTKARESSEIADIFATENQETITESHSNTAAIELFAINTEASNTFYTADADKHESNSEEQEETECVTYRESENRITFSGPNEACANDIEANESPETSYITATENPEHFKELNRDRTIYAAALELSETNIEAQETSPKPYTCGTDKHESSSVKKQDIVMDKETLKFSTTESEKQTSRTEPEGECITETKSENGIPLSKQKDQCAYEPEPQETSDIPASSDTVKQESSSEATIDSFMVAEISTTERKKQTPSNELREEKTMYKETENQIRFSEQKEECANDTQAKFFSETPYIFPTENQESINILNRDTYIVTVELFAIDTEAKEASETHYTSDKDKHESNSKGDSVMSKKAPEFSATDNEKQTCCTVPKEEYITDAKSESEIHFSKQKDQSAYEAETHKASETQVAYDTEPGAGYVMDEESTNRITFSKQNECAYETEAHKTSETLVTSDTNKQESSSETRGEYVKDKEALEFSATENKKQSSCTEPEGEFIMNTESENGISFSIQKEECAFDVEDHESSSEEKGDSVMDTETAKISTTNHEKQNPFNVTDTEIDNRTSSNDPKKECGKNTKARESSETADIFATDNQETITESHLNRVKNTAAIELFESNTEASNTFYTVDTDKHESNSEEKEETECVTARESENRITFSGPKEEYANDTEPREFSETSYISATENPEHFTELNRDRAIGTVPLVSETNTEAQGALEKPYTCDIDKNESSSAEETDIVMDKEALKFSTTENEKQTSRTEPEGECITETKSENGIPLSKKKDQCAYEPEAQETSDIPTSSDTVKQESSSEVTIDSFMVAEISTTEREKQTPSNELREEKTMYKETENRIRFSEQNEKCDNDIQAKDFSETPYISATENLKPINILNRNTYMDRVELFARDKDKHKSSSKEKGDSVMSKKAPESSATDNENQTSETQVTYDTEPGAGYVMDEESTNVMDEESTNQIPSSIQKDSAYETETHKTSKTLITSDIDKLESSSETKGDIVKDKDALEFSATENKKQTSCTEPEGEFIMNTECEKGISLSMQKEECAFDVEDHEYSSEEKGDSVVDTETAKISTTSREKQNPFNVRDTKSDNRTSSNDPKKECGKNTKARESSETADIFATENLETITESHLNRVKNKAAIELFASNTEASNTCYTVDIDKHESNSEEKDDNIQATEAVEDSAPQREKQNPSNEPETECVTYRESENRITCSGPKEECANDIEARESPETSYITATENTEHFKELNRDRTIDKAALELSETNTETQEAKSENGIPLSKQKYQCAYEPEPQETSDIPASSDTVKQESSSEATIDSFMVAEISTTEREKQTPSNELREEKTMYKETENQIRFSEQKEECDNDTQAKFFSETPYISATENQKSINILNRDTYMVTVELFAIDTEAKEASETHYTSDKDKHESNSKGDSVMSKKAPEFSATDNEKQTCCTVPKEEYITDAKSESEIHFSKQTDQSAYEAETHKASETQVAYDTEPGAEYVMDEESTNRITFSKQNECAYETEAHKTSETLVTSDTNKQESSNETRGEYVKDKEALEFSATENKKQSSCTEPEGEFIMNTESENRISFSIQKEECAFDVEDHEYSSGEKGDSLVDTETAKISTTSRKKQNPFNVTDTEIDNRTSSNDSKKECGKNTKATESSETADIFATQNLETITESHLKRVKNTAAIELFASNTEASNTSYTVDIDKHKSNSEEKEGIIEATEAVEDSAPQREKQNPSNKPETECVTDRESENRITFSGTNEECANDIEATESPETSYISATENPEHFKELNRDRTIDTAVLELSETNIEAQETSPKPYTCDTDKHESSSAKKQDIVMDKEALKFSTTESEKQTAYTEPEGECITEKKAQETSDIPASSDIVKQEFSSEATTEISTTEREKPTPSNELREEKTMYKETENQIRFSEQKEECDNDTQAKCFSKTPYISATENQESINILNRDTYMVTVELFAIDTEAKDSSETHYTSNKDKHESSSEEKGDSGMDKEALEFCKTESEKQTPRTEPEGECITDTKSENENPFRKQPDHCAYEPVAYKTLDIPTFSDTVKQESSSEAIRDSFIVAEISTTDREKQKPSNELKEEKAVQKETENQIPFSEQREEFDNYTQVREFSETSYISTTDSLETISESHLNRVMDTAARELFAINRENSNTSYTADIDKHKSHSEEKKDSIAFTEEVENSATHREKQKLSNEPEKEDIVKVQKALEFSATESEKQTSRIEPEGECFTDTRSENEISINKQVATEQEISCESKRDNIMDTDVEEFSEPKSQKQIPGGECVIDKDTESRPPCNESEEEFGNSTGVQGSSYEGSEIQYTYESEEQDHVSNVKKNAAVNTKAVEFSAIVRPTTEDCVNEAEAQQTSETLYLCDIVIHESNSDVSGKIGVDTNEEELSAAETEKEKNSIETEAEYIMENGNRIPVREKKEESDNNTEARKHSETPYSKASNGNNNVCVEALEFFATDFEVREFSEPLYSSDADKHECNCDANGDNIMAKKTVVISATESEKQKSCSKPEEECATATQDENGMSFIEQKEDCLIETEPQEFPAIAYSSDTYKPEYSSEAKEDTELELSSLEIEKQKDCNDDTNTESGNRISFIEQKEECLIKTDAQECSAIPCSSDTNKPEYISEAKGGTEVELSSLEIEKQNHINYETDTENENRISFSKHKEQCLITTEAQECFAIPYSSDTNSLSIQIADIAIPLKSSKSNRDSNCNLEEKLATEPLESGKETNLVIQNFLSDGNVPNRKTHDSCLSLDVDLCKSNNIITVVENVNTAETIESLKTDDTETNVRKPPKDNSLLSNIVITITNDSCKPTEIEPVKNLSEEIDISKCSNEITSINDGITTGTTPANDNHMLSNVVETSETKLSDLNIFSKNNGTVIVELLSLKPPITKQLRRQSHKIDVTSSDEKCSLRTIMYIATMSKTLINDKRLLASLERRRRQTEIMQKYLRSLDSFEFEFESEYLNQDLLEEQSFILSTPPPPLPKANIAAEINSYFAKSLRELKSNFLKNNLFSDELSSDTNQARKITPTTTESYIAVYSNDQCINRSNKCNNSFVNTTNLTNGAYPNLTPCTKSNGKQGQQFIYNNNYERDNNGEEDDIVPLRHFVPGSIAEREYKKWNNAVEMPNNPYSPEALKRRISGSQERFIDLPNINSSTNKNVISITETTKAEDDAENENRSDIGYKRYSRDYYINTGNTPKVSPKHQIHRNDRRKRFSSGCSDELIADTVTKESISQGNETIAIENPNVIHPTVYLALPVQVVEESTSFEALSNQSMQPVNTTNSDDSDTICISDFKKQTTVVVHNEGKPLKSDTTVAKTQQETVEPFQDTATKFNPKKDTCKVSCQKELSFETAAAASCVSTPTLGPTPNAFKFLQPKRRLIDPSQMLPLNEEAQVLSFGEKPVVEEEVAQVMPSVKALAQAFLLSSNKCSQAEKRWKKGIQKMPSTSIKFNNPPETYTENIVKIQEKNEDSTISSDLSSLETDPSIHVNISTNETSTSPPERTANNEENNNKNTTNMLRRVSMLKSNIAFFENLKFK